MMNPDPYQDLLNFLQPAGVTLVAVSKIQPNEKIMELYGRGQRVFGENYVQELTAKAGALPTDIQWHFIGHLQTNKVKQIVPVVTMIQGVDSLRLLLEIEKQAAKINRPVDCLLQIHISTEETKFGLNGEELRSLLIAPAVKDLRFARIRGLMGMASFSDDLALVRAEFMQLKTLYHENLDFFRKTGEPVLSMGMSGDYRLAVDCGSTMVRIGSLLFGARKVQ